MPMPTALRLLQYIGCVATELTNGLLFAIILTRKPNKLGTYKYLMMSFTIFSMIYAIVEILTQPVMYIYGTGILLYVNSFLKDNQTYGFHVAALYTSSFGICVFLLSTHFFYRYLAVCKPHRIQYFSGKRLLLLFLPPLIFGTLWFLAVELYNRPTQFSMEFSRKSLMNFYGEDTFTVAHLSAIYYHYDSSGNVIIEWDQCVQIMFLNMMMSISIQTIVHFAWKTYKTVNSHQTQMSKRTHDMQKQLFYTLLLQSVIPFFTLFMPVGLFFILPFFNVNIGVLANIPSAYISFYPAVDACIAIFMIKDFRRALCGGRHKVSITSVSSSKVSR